MDPIFTKTLFLNPFSGFLAVFFIKREESRQAQLSTYGVLGEESDFQVKNKQFRCPEAKKKEKRN